MLFKEWIKLRENNLLIEGDLLDDVISTLKRKEFDTKILQRVVYDYLTQHSDRADAVKKMLTSDIKKYSEYNAAYKKLLDLVAQKLSNIGYTFYSTGAWAQYDRNGGSGNAKKDDNMTTKRYVSLDINDIWKAFQKLPVLGEALNKVKLRPEADKLSFKVSGNYGSAMQHKDTIVIHFYDKNAGPQIDQAVQKFLNAAGVKESDRSSMGRVNFGKDADGTSDSDLIALRISKYFDIHKDKIPQMLQMPNFKQQLKSLIDNISMNSSHRSGVRV
jgi:hypothetical protein